MKQYQLVVFDMDGVIFEHKNFWMELHKALGTYEEGVRLTKKYLHTNYQRLVKEVVGRLWKGKDATPYYELIQRIPYVKGAPETLKELKRRGYTTAIISSSAKHLALRVKEECGLDYYHTYDVKIANNHFTGEYEWDTAHKDKSEHLKQFAQQAGCTLKETIFVGHDHNDITALRQAGLGIAFCPEEEDIRRAADITINHKDLREVLRIINKTENA